MRSRAVPSLLLMAVLAAGCAGAADTASEGLDDAAGAAQSLSESLPQVSVTDVPDTDVVAAVTSAVPGVSTLESSELVDAARRTCQDIADGAQDDLVVQDAGDRLRDAGAADLTREQASRFVDSARGALCPS